jgi:hypothetical protein
MRMIFLIIIKRSAILHINTYLNRLFRVVRIISWTATIILSWFVPNITICLHVRCQLSATIYDLCLENTICVLKITICFFFPPIRFSHTNPLSCGFFSSDLASPHTRPSFSPTYLPTYWLPGSCEPGVSGGDSSFC